MVNDFIFELGCEELPSGLVWPLADEFAQLLLAQLDKAELSYGMVERFATPRRIGIVIHALASQQKNQQKTRRGPAVSAAFDPAGNPTPALIGFAQSCGVAPEQLTRAHTDKGDWMVFDALQEGVATRCLLPEMVRQALTSLSIPKPMRWGAFVEVFARPVHWAVMMYGDEVLEHPILGIQSGGLSYGHRFHHPEPIAIKSARAYEAQMKESYVIADFAARKALIEEQVKQLAAKHHAFAVIPESLLDEVTSIVEWPIALLAHFDAAFLEVPAEALIASMQSHQKCFALKDAQDKILPYFITVSNIASQSPKQVVLGNEKVMRARLSDAAFFYASDKKNPLSQHIESTKRVVFQASLGSVYDKSIRMQALMPHLSQALEIPLNLAKRATALSKCDLMTGMVGEFPELEGLMGYYYALNDGEDKTVACALNEQYMPRFAEDALPQTQLGLALSLADRLDTLVGIFGIGQTPTGVKDPFKLRRHALAVVRMLVAIPAPLNLSTLIDEVASNYGDCFSAEQSCVSSLQSFILERLNSYYLNQGISIELVNAVRRKQEDWLYDLDMRLNALKAFVQGLEASSLAAACKRVNHLLKQSGSANALIDINTSLLEPGAEKALYECVQHSITVVEPLYRTGDYGALLKHLASLKEPIDAFFETVMVMVEDAEIKKNRIALLYQLQSILQGVADISLL
jgi:glycyl-tRNA synthetase beta chain